MQAFEPNYRWDSSYRLSQDPLTKNTASTVSPLSREFHGFSPIQYISIVSPDIIDILL